ncbi:ATP-binding protein [Ruminobacter sp.]|nr:ATP-binding protein [Ruminobacter sp.]
MLGDTTAATAILDRLLHHCSVLTINGDSYRLLATKKANLLAKNESLS